MNAAPDPIPRLTLNHRGSRWRLLTALFAAVGFAFGVVSLLIWYQQDRPLQEISAALKSGRTAEALKGVNSYLVAHPQDAKPMILKGRILVEVGQLSDAIHIFRRFGAADVTDLHAWAKAHLLRKEWSDALPILQQLLKLKPDDADGLHEITACLSFLGQYNQAIQSAEQMSKLKGHEARAYVQLGTLHENLGNKKSAVDAWGRVLLFSPKAEGLQIPAADFLTTYGSVLLDLGRLSEATLYLKQGLELRETADGRLRLGNALQQTDQPDEALESWRRAVELDPQLHAPRESLAEEALGNRRFDEARQWLEPLLNKPDLASSTTYLMQRLTLASGDRESSKQWQARTAKLHQREHLKGVVERVIAESPDSTWSRAIRAHRFAEAGNWHQAEMLMQNIDLETGEEPFLQQLSTAIRRHSGLPSLDLLPIHHFQ